MNHEGGTSEETPRPRRRLGTTSQVLLALALGTSVGLFFGELVAWMTTLGDIYVGLLQMTVLPYITVSLIANVGRLTWSEGRRLLGYGAVVTAGLWVLGLTVVALAPLALPAWETGSFFRPSMLEEPASVDFLDLFLPLNVFGSLARNVVPAVVTFCLAVGIALIGMKRKQPLLDVLETAAEALMRVNKAVIRLTPIGVFAIAAGVAATMSLDQVSRLQGYLILYTAMVLYLALVFLPLLIAALAPFTYREILRASKDALVTAFATGKVLIVLPLLIENTKAMFAARAPAADEARRASEVMYPLAYPFPSLGKVLALLFVPFAAWFSGLALGWLQYPAFLGSGLFSMFGGPVVAIPFLLDVYELPADLFQLFVAAGVWTARVGDFLSAMHLLAVAVLTTAWSVGMIRVRWGALLRLGLVSVGVLLLLLVGVRSYLSGTLEDREDPAAVVARMDLLARARGLADRTVVLETATPNPDPRGEGEGILARIRRRGAIRVGFTEDAMPWSYRNASGSVVGFDVDMAHRLAADLDVRLELVPLDREGLVEHLAADHADVVMAGVAGSVRLAERMRFSDAYLDLHLALLVPDTLVRTVETLASVRAAGDLSIGNPEASEFVDLLPRMLPNVKVIDGVDVRAFAEGRAPKVEALLISAEAGAFWTLLYPRLRVVRPRGATASVPLVYPYAGDDDSFDEFMDHWVRLKTKDGTVDRAYAHWVLGGDAVPKKPRWSVIRDVLGWVD